MSKAIAESTCNHKCEDIYCRIACDKKNQLKITSTQSTGLAGCVPSIHSMELYGATEKCVVEEYLVTWGNMYKPVYKPNVTNILIKKNKHGGKSKRYTKVLAVVIFGGGIKVSIFLLCLSTF